MEPKKLFSSIGVIITSVIAVILFITEYEKLNLFFFHNESSISTPLYLVSIPGFCLLIFYVMYLINFNERTKHKKTITELQNVKGLLLDAERLRLIDFVTGIPNQEKFKLDLLNRPNELFHLILIDLDSFGDINKKQGFQKGDEIIRTIALDLVKKMRRDEEIYKRDYKIEASFMKRVYRKYTGGDEFIFLIKGPQYESVGFLTRIQKQLTQLSNSSVVFNNYKISFHAAIVPLNPIDTYEQAYDRLQRAYVQAAEESDHLKVFWDRNVEESFSDYKFIYDTAKREFRV